MTIIFRFIYKRDADFLTLVTVILPDLKKNKTSIMKNAIHSTIILTLIFFAGYINGMAQFIDSYHPPCMSCDSLKYLRLFLLPRVLHCGGGPGPDRVDWIKLIRDWVENGQAPERVVLSKMQDGKVFMTRPVFPYPRKAVYDGKGDSNVDSSFR
jgi:hypothetical protein